jgi:hypothetical protein
VPDINDVCSNELLYRRVPDRLGDFYKPIDGGAYRVTSGAFGDKKQRPSVDRAKLRDNDPEKSKKKSTDCVVSFTVAEVRGIRGFGTIDVEADPNPLEDPDNPAHALITADPPFSSKNQFGKFKQVMARVADSRWEISPPERI